MKYKDNRNLWDYIPYIMIAICVFTIIWWSIVLNAAAEEVTPTTTYDTYTYQYKSYSYALNGSEYLQNLQSSVNGTITYDTSKPVCLVKTTTTTTSYGTTSVKTSYQVVSKYSYSIMDSYNGHDYAYTLNQSITTTEGTLYSNISLTRTNQLDSYEGSAGWPAFTNREMATYSSSGIAIADSYESAYAYLTSGNRTGIEGLPAQNIYNPEIPSPDGYYLETTGLAHNGFNVYTNDVVLTNMGTYKAVVYMRYRTVDNLYMQRVSNTSPFTNVWWNTDIKTTWTAYKHISDSYNGTTLGNNNVRGIQGPDDNFEDWLETKAETRVETELTPSGSQKANKEFLVPWAQINAQLKRTDYVWNSIEYLVFYYTVLPNGDISFGPSTFFYKDYPPNLQGTIVNGYEESAVLFDGTGYGVSKGYSNTESQSIVEGTASFGLKNLTEVDASGIVTVNDNGITINQGNNSLTTNGLGIESLQIGQMQQNFETIYTFVGAVPTAMAQWFGFMPSWIFSLIAFEISMLIVFGIVKKIVG